MFCVECLLGWFIISSILKIMMGFIYFYLEIIFPFLGDIFYYLNDLLLLSYRSSTVSVSVSVFVCGAIAVIADIRLSKKYIYKLNSINKNN